MNRLNPRLRILFVLPGLHRVDRGAEVAFMRVAEGLVERGHEVTLFGSGPSRSGQAYRYRQVSCISRKRFEGFPRIPVLRHEYAYEELSFLPGLAMAYRASDFDVTVTCSYPFTNWLLQRRKAKGPPHVFVTQNGDWPAVSNRAEFKFFDCDGLVCTNPEYFERNRAQWNCALIPNGILTAKFVPGASDRPEFGLPEGVPVILMVSALMDSKRVAAGVRAVAKIPEAVLVVAGDGPLRNDIDRLASDLLPQRFKRVTLPAEAMPRLYRCADVFMHLSLEEAFGNVYLEALATGLPVVAHDTPHVRWIVGDEFLADTQNESALIGAINDALRSPASLGEARVARAQGFDWTGIALKYEEFLLRVVENSREQTQVA